MQIVRQIPTGRKVMRNNASDCGADDMNMAGILVTASSGHSRVQHRARKMTPKHDALQSGSTKQTMLRGAQVMALFQDDPKHNSIWIRQMDHSPRTKML